MSKGRHVTSLGLSVFSCKQKCWLSELPFDIRVLEFHVRTQVVRRGRWKSSRGGKALSGDLGCAQGGGRKWL